jgi:SulP family sulfate permease
LAAVFHGVLIMVIVLFLAPLASSIPLAVLAGILMVVAARMAESEAVRVILRSTKSDAFVLVLTMVVTIVFDLILAIEVGMVAAGILFIIRMSKPSQHRRRTNRNRGRGSTRYGDRDRRGGASLA